jgi:hypothetical protein
MALTVRDLQESAAKRALPGADLHAERACEWAVRDCGQQGVHLGRRVFPMSSRPSLPTQNCAAIFRSGSFAASICSIRSRCGSLQILQRLINSLAVSPCLARPLADDSTRYISEKASHRTREGSGNPAGA